MTIILIKASLFTEEDRKFFESKISFCIVIRANIEKSIEVYDSCPPVPQIQDVPYQPYQPYYSPNTTPNTIPYSPTNPPYQATC